MSTPLPDPHARRAGDRADDSAFMKEADAVRAMRPVAGARFLVLSVCALVGLFFLWAGGNDIDVIVHGDGQVVPSREVQIVQSLEGGILQEILVSQGDLVQKGDVLVRISDILFSAEERGADATFAGLRVKKARLEAEAHGMSFEIPEDISGKYPTLATNETALYHARRQEFDNALAILEDKIASAAAQLAETRAQIARLSGNLGQLRKELDITERMVQQKAAPEIEAIRLRRESGDITGRMQAEKERAKSLEADLRAITREKDDQADRFRIRALGELNEVETRIAALQENLRSMEDRVFRTDLRAPVTGVVNNIAVKTVGGVVEPAMRLVEIVPVDDDLKIIAKISPNDIAFVQTGQRSRVSITAYDPQRYGHLEGTITRIGATSVSDRDGNSFFEIEVRTDKNHLGTPEKPLPISAGMLARVSVLTGKRTILEYLTKPVLRLKDRAFTER